MCCVCYLCVLQRYSTYGGDCSSDSLPRNRPFINNVGNSNELFEHDPFTIHNHIPMYVKAIYTPLSVFVYLTCRSTLSEVAINVHELTEVMFALEVLVLTSAL